MGTGQHNVVHEAGRSTSVVRFLRRRDYSMVKELGRGACGKTVLLYDQQIDEHFVCKKYVPSSEDHRQDLFAGFVREIKLLHKVLHPNVVRIFNYYLYPEQFSGYILMEHVDGPDVDDYLAESHKRYVYSGRCGICVPGASRHPASGHSFRKPNGWW